MSTQAPWAARHGGPPGRSRAGWLVAVAVVWAVLLAGLAYASVRHGAPTVREQRDIAQAARVADRAIGELVAAAGPEALVELAAPRYDTGCRVSVLRYGTALDRVVTFRTRPDDASALLTGIADRLPASYRAGTHPGRGDSGPTLRADAGEFVGVHGGVTAPGVVELTASTGCRPPVAGFAGQAEPLIGLPIDAEPARPLTALHATGVTPGERVSVPCPGGGVARTARATGQVAAASPLAPAAPAGAVVVTDEPDLYAYRSGALSVVLRRSGDQVRVAVGTGCPAG
ncbi:hypothetical protein [Micromonospora zhanjiangensis]|uniref:Uncharacterized protein n=1 Tax=Micromonospora zhanjiangensis TaxID=1522057 RepID=A0ABV8KET4_9ACTN